MLADLKKSPVTITHTYIVPAVYEHLVCWDLWYVDEPRDMDYIKFIFTPLFNVS